MSYESNYRSDESQSVGSGKHNKISRLDAHGYESKIQDLLEKIDILERKLKQTTDNKQKFLLKLKSTEEDNEMLKNQLNRQAAQIKQLNSEIASQANKISELQTANRQQSEKYKTKFEILNKELEDKETNIDKLVNKIKAKDDTVKFLTVNNEMTMKSHTQIKEETAALLKTNSELEQEIRRLNNKVDTLTINNRSEASLQLEIEHLKDDNVRLLQMLKSTEEFKDFAYLAENVTGGIHYIKGSTSSSTRRNTKENEKRSKGKFDSFTNVNWVPSETVQYMNKFKSLYNLNDEVINEILLGLNKIWSERESKLVSRVKQSYQGEIMALRRKAAYKNPYDEVQTGKTISKLKKDLRKTKDDLKETKIIAKKLKTNPSGIDLIDNAMKVAANFQRTKHILEKEINNLKGKIKEDKDIPKFDSSWVVDRIVTEYGTLESQINELCNEYEDRIKNAYTLGGNEFNAKLVNNSWKWFNQSLNEMILELKEKFLLWQFELQKNLDSLKYI